MSKPKVPGDYWSLNCLSEGLPTINNSIRNALVQGDCLESAFIGEWFTLEKMHNRHFFITIGGKPIQVFLDRFGGFERMEVSDKV
jgi:hypothetical protein